MDLNKYEAFLSVADSGSFTAAGRILGYSQSGITRMIASLEQELGFSLFIRSKKGVELSENGKLMMPVIRNAVKAGRSAQEMGAQIRGVITGTIALGCYFSVSAILLPDILKSFETKYPGIQIRIHEGGTSDIARWLDQGSIEMAICARPKTESEYKWIPLMQDEMVVWLPKNHPKASLKAFPVHDMEKEPFIHTSPDRDTDQDRIIAKEGLHMNEKYTTQDGFTTWNMVAAGLGISFNQTLISRKWQGDVVLVPMKPRQYIEMGIALPEGSGNSPAVKVFIRHIKECLDKQENK